MDSRDSAVVTEVLTYLGATPFIAVAIIIAMDVSVAVNSHSPLSVILCYGLAIISFMAGALWGTQKHSLEVSSCAILLISNLITVSAWLGFIILTPQLLLLLFCLLFLLLLAVDFWLYSDRQISRSYWVLRYRVTSIVVACLLATLIAL